MALSIGIVGLPNVGKSTLFNALTKNAVDAQNYPFCTIDPSVGVVPVPDIRLDKLAEFSRSEKKLPAVVEFTDIAGLVKGAAEGEGLGNKFLANIREVDAIAQVVRIFKDENIAHVHGDINPLSDIEVINLELILSDRETVTKRLGTLVKETRVANKEGEKEKEILEKIDKALDDGQLASNVKLSNDEEKIIKGIHLLTRKPFLFVLNKKNSATNLDEENDENYQKLLEFFKDTNSGYVIVDAGFESEIKDLDSVEKDEFRKDEGVDTNLNELITESYKMLDLISFFTTGEKESRAWTIKRDSTAPQAGAAIHTDFQDKFIRADIIQWQTLLEAGSHTNARDKGQIRTEGKDYVVQDGDVIEFKI